MLLGARHAAFQTRAVPRQRPRRPARQPSVSAASEASFVREGPTEDRRLPAIHRPQVAPTFVDRARVAMRLAHLSPRTEDAYIGWVRRFHQFHGRRDPADLGGEHVARFLSALATRGRVSASTQNQALAALLFLYREVLGRDLPWMSDITRAKTPDRLPVVLSRDEVRAVLSRLEASRA